MRRILIVDHSPDTRQRWEALLSAQQSHWDVAYASGSNAALASLETFPRDVVICDLQEAAHESVPFLTQVRRQFPQVARILLSENSRGGAMSAVSVAHQILPQTLDLAVLRVAVERACRLSELFEDESIRRAVGALGELPALPRVYAEVTEALANDRLPLQKVGALIGQDVALSAKILQMANSALFSPVNQIQNPQSAVCYLGSNLVRGLVHCLGAFQNFGRASSIPGFSMEALQAHSQLTARIAPKLLSQAAEREIAFIAALLHDVGKLVLAAQLPGRFARFLETARSQGRPLYEVEMEMAGVTHAEIGAYLLGLWGLPFPVVEAVAYHHAPTKLPHHSFDALAAVHVADILAHHAAPQAQETLAQATPDMDFLAELGLAEQWPEWLTTWGTPACEHASAN